MEKKIFVITLAAFTGALLVLLGGCADHGPTMVTEVECRLSSDCELGSYCHPFLQLCGWDCQNDTECGVGEYCDAESGRCIRSEMPVPVPPMPEGATALVVEFAPRYGNLIPNIDWNNVGTVELTAFGGDVAIGAIDMSGANLARFDSFALMQAARIVTSSVATESITRIPLSAPVIVREGERVTFDVVARLRTPVEYFGTRIIVRPEGASAAPVEDGEPTRVVLSRIRESEFRLWQSIPSVTLQALSTTTLANGVDQDLFKAHLGASYTASVTIGSLTLRLLGLAGTLSNFRARIGSTDLPFDAYRVYNAYGEPIDLRSGTLDVRGPASALTEVITIVFLDGLVVSGSGVIITLHATPAEFGVGSNLITLFGDRNFGGLSGDITPEGRILSFDGLHERTDTDAIVWTDGTRPDVWTGSWGIEDLTQMQALTR